jgi:hypothetical protein
MSAPLREGWLRAGLDGAGAWLTRQRVARLLNARRAGEVRSVSSRKVVPTIYGLFSAAVQISEMCELVKYLQNCANVCNATSVWVLQCDEHLGIGLAAA